MDIFLDVLAIAAIAAFILIVVSTPLYLMLKYTVKKDQQNNHLPH
ncbi:hypothetical protein MNBD_GAMMA22-1708 [hydrothermal vent metagenome]|uniref:Uncharacterized protein n=1 Tax=hydrothermal vent metagenome TaxID=652676 RepID=A0A3B0ZTB9_9ZZZZ